MMMSVSDLGLLASMLNMCMNQSFAAHLGHQGPYVPAFDSSCLVILRRNYKAEIYCGHWTVHANQ